MNTEMCDIEPIHNQIVFRFVEDTSKGRFNQKTGSGVIVVDHADKQVDYCRWGRVLAMGPDVKTTDFSTGSVVLIKNLRWTNEFTFDDRSYWITTEDEILATLPDENDAPGEIKNFL